VDPIQLSGKSLTLMGYLENSVSSPCLATEVPVPGSLAPFVRGKCRAPRLEAAYAGRIMQGLEQCGASELRTS